MQSRKLNACAKTFSRLLLKRFLDCLPPAAKTRVLLLEAESVTCFVRESRRLWRCGDTSWISFLIPFPYNHLNPSSASFCEERSSQSNHAGKQRPCATQSELSLSCSGALNARSECSIRGPGPRACTSTGCTGSTAAAFCKMARRSPCRGSRKRNDDWMVVYKTADFCRRRKAIEKTFEQESRKRFSRRRSSFLDCT